MNKFIVIRSSDPCSIEIENETGSKIPIGALIQGALRITSKEIIDLSFVQDYVDDIIQEETEELNEEIVSLWELLNKKDEVIEGLTNKLNKKEE